jgi:DNA-binding transcriptional ArsR family regulator
MANKGNQSGRRRAWKKAEVAELDRLIRQGKPAHVIARKLGRPLWAIYNRRDVTKRRRGVVYGRGELARLFGVDDNVPAIWQRHGWLPHTRNGAYAAQQTDAQQQAYAAWRRELEPALVSVREDTDPITPGRMASYLITDTAIEAFLANRDTWYAWDVADITDPAWRKLAETLRAQSTGRWLTTEEVAARLGVVVGTVRMWHERGWTEGLTVARYGIHLYWWSTDLDHWTQPGERRRISHSGVRALTMAYAGVTSTELAAALDVPISVASRRLKLLYECGLLRREVDPAQPNRYRYWRA